MLLNEWGRPLVVCSPVAAVGGAGGTDDGVESLMPATYDRSRRGLLNIPDTSASGPASLPQRGLGANGRQ